MRQVDLAPGRRASCAAVEDLEERIDALFAGPPGEFTASRAALVKELRAAGEREEAERVAELRRPTKIAAELNRLAREEPDGLAAAIAAEEGLADVQARMLEGAAAAEEMATATEAEAAAVAALSGDVAVRAAIRAAARRDEERELLRRGRLSRDPEPDLGSALFGGAAPPPAPAAPPRGRSRGAPARDEPAVDELAERRARKAEQAAADRTASLGEARELARTATGNARAARKRLTDAGRAREKAERARERADAELAALRERLEDAERAAAERAGEADEAAGAEARAAEEAERAERLAEDAERLVDELRDL
jgi:hypothetical protein